MTEYLKVIDAPGLERDPVSKAILCADMDALKEHRKKKQMMLAMVQKNKDLEIKIENVQNELSDIKTLLYKLLETK